MGIAIEQEFSLDASRDLVWSLLVDPPRIVACLPGAALTNKVDDRTYEGTITVKVGPVTATYKGKVRFDRLDATQGETELSGQGQETRGKGSADMRMRCRLQPAGAGRTSVSVTCDLAVTGLLAQFGRGMIQEVSDRMVQQFTTQMRQVLEKTRVRYQELVKAHAQAFARTFPAQLAEVESAAGFSIAVDGTNGAAGPGDVVRYLDAVRKVGGDVPYTSAKLTIRNVAQRENIPLPAL
jgi:uncharacterized protein